MSNINGTLSADTLNGTLDDDVIKALAGNDTINGSDGDDILDGGKGADSLSGGDGDDTYIIDNLADIINEISLTDIDTVKTSLSNYTLGVNLENLILTGNAVIGNGNALNNHIIGTTGTNILDGGSGTDILEGGKGNDTYILDDDISDVIIEAFNSGIDTVKTTFSYSLNLVENVENIILQGTDHINARGNALNNVITGNSGDNELNGGVGNDTLSGGDGADMLDGGLGADAMTGGNGNDTYTIDNVKDRVTEASKTGGIDTVKVAIIDSSATTYYLGKNVENAILIDNNDIYNLIGNSGNNVLTGNSRSLGNFIDGGAGNDTIIGGNGNNSYLYGGAGNDFIVGGTNNDTIEGAAGNDTLDGGAGINMVSYVYSTSAVTVNLSVVGEQNTIGAGKDVLTNFDNILGSQFSDKLTGNADDNSIRGYFGNDSIFGGDGNDTLRGEAGNDQLYGELGDDTLNGGLGNDIINGGDGNDTASYSESSKAVNVNLALTTSQNTVGAGRDTFVSIENLIGSSFADTLLGNNADNSLNGLGGNDTLNGLDGSDILLGGAGIDVLNGGAGADSLNGGAGKDVLTGGLDGDHFIFSSVADVGYAATADEITDFSQTQSDLIDLSLIDANSLTTGVNDAFTFVGTAAFSGGGAGGAGQLRFDLSTHSVYGDVNGDGISDFQISLIGVNNLTASDFIL